MSKLHEFCTGVASDTFEVDKNALNEDRLGIDISSILAFIEVIAQVINTVSNMCPNQKALKNSIKNPTWLQRVRFKVAMREHLDSSGHFSLRSVAGRAADNCMKAAARLTDEEIEAVLAETRNDPDNWLL